MTPPADPERYKHHRFPSEIISHGVWLSYRFPLSYRAVQELLFERGIDHDPRGHQPTVQRSVRYCQGWNTVRITISTTGVRTRIVLCTNESVACKGANLLVMPSVFCRRMDLLPNTSDHDGMCCPRRSTTRRCRVDSRVGPK